MPFVYDIYTGKLRMVEPVGTVVSGYGNPDIIITDPTYNLAVATNSGEQAIIAQVTTVITMPQISTWGGWYPLVYCDGDGITVSYTIVGGDTYNGVASIDSLVLRNYAQKFKKLGTTRASVHLMEP